MPFGQIRWPVNLAIKRIPFVPASSMHVHVICGHHGRRVRAARGFINPEPEPSRRSRLRFDPESANARLVVVVIFHASESFGVSKFSWNSFVPSVK